MTTVYADIDPMEQYEPGTEKEIWAKLGRIPDIVLDAYTTTRHTKKVTYLDVLGAAYGHSPTKLKASFKDGLLTYPLDDTSEPRYPLANFILSYGDYGTISVFQYSGSLVHVLGAETFTVRLD